MQALIASALRPNPAHIRACALVRARHSRLSVIGTETRNGQVYVSAIWAVDGNVHVYSVDVERETVAPYLY